MAHRLAKSGTEYSPFSDIEATIAAAQAIDSICIPIGLRRLDRSRALFARARLRALSRHDKSGVHFRRRCSGNRKIKGIT